MVGLCVAAPLLPDGITVIVGLLCDFMIEPLLILVLDDGQIVIHLRNDGEILFRHEHTTVALAPLFHFPETGRETDLAEWIHGISAVHKHASTQIASLVTVTRNEVFKIHIASMWINTQLNTTARPGNGCPVGICLQGV